ncbi:hypothetical protein A3715_08835 [Oleiphilus sp. HI0009]|nr:hypothetical protein A3715_08835 [Oleiphilus sp. HI0009]KZY64434.1 hypothetical protein A3738_10280 [Oleiphilus sp. HI0066]
MVAPGAKQMVEKCSLKILLQSLTIYSIFKNTDCCDNKLNSDLILAIKNILTLRTELNKLITLLLAMKHGLLTPTLKINRNEIENNYKEV